MEGARRSPSLRTISSSSESSHDGGTNINSTLYLTGQVSGLVLIVNLATRHPQLHVLPPSPKKKIFIFPIRVFIYFFANAIRTLSQIQRATDQRAAWVRHAPPFPIRLEQQIVKNSTKWCGIFFYVSENDSAVCNVVLSRRGQEFGFDFKSFFVRFQNNFYSIIVLVYFV